MTLHSPTYQHWNEQHLGIWSRRWVIATNGLKGVLQTRFMKVIVTFCWIFAFAAVTLLFLIGQLLVKDSLVYQWLTMLGSEAAQNRNSLIPWLVGWLESNPQISVRVLYNIIFHYFTWYLSPFAVLVVAMTIPQMITRDLASNAITIYASKAVGKWDYLIGKVSSLLMLLGLTWLGPVLAAWIMGNLLSPDWHFFWHSRMALWNSLLYIGSSIAILAVLGLGFSAISGKEKTTVGLWMAFWVLGWAFVGLGVETERDWLKYFSFTYNLEQISVAAFQLKEEFRLAQASVPVMGDFVKNLQQRGGEDWQVPHLRGAMTGLGIMLAFAAAMVVRKVKPE
jgi:ABC-2 type transport system permease protein